VSITQNTGSPFYAGTIDDWESTTQAGVACTNDTASAGGVREFSLIDVSGPNVLSNPPGPTFSLNTTYQISQQRLGSGAWRCSRDGQALTSGVDSFIGNGQWGIVTRLASATFDYVLIVGH
jgi:hypothetical protein